MHVIHRWGRHARLESSKVVDEDFILLVDRIGHIVLWDVDSARCDLDGEVELGHWVLHPAQRLATQILHYKLSHPHIVEVDGGGGVEAEARVHHQLLIVSIIITTSFLLFLLFFLFTLGVEQRVGEGNLHEFLLALQRAIGPTAVGRLGLAIPILLGRGRSQPFLGAHFFLVVTRVLMEVVFGRQQRLRLELVRYRGEPVGERCDADQEVHRHHVEEESDPVKLRQVVRCHEVAQQQRSLDSQSEPVIPFAKWLIPKINKK